MRMFETLRTFSLAVTVAGTSLPLVNSVFAGESGKLSREIWQNIPGGQLTEFIYSPRYWQPADVNSVFAGAVAPSDAGDHFASRVRGYVTAPISGEYTFWIAADDDAELRLSTDDSKFHRVKIASLSGFVDPQAWDVKPSQQSVSISLVEGQRYFIEALQKEGAFGDHLAIAWQVPGGEREVVPASALESFTVDTNDVDNDELPDDWEIAHEFSLADNGTLYPDQHPLADPDNNGLTNLEDSGYPTSPSRPAGPGSGESGKMTREFWYSIPGGQLSHFTTSPRYWQTADAVTTFSGSAGPMSGDNDFAARIRAYVTPAVSGDHTFWIASDDDSELYLSSDASKFNRVKIASQSGYVDPLAWDVKLSQKSVVVTLVAGQHYFIEALHKDGVGGDHCAIAWQAPGGTRELIPEASLESFTIDPNDRDNDELPDDWELANGFSIQDNGRINLAQHPLADPDHDGLSNLQESKVDGSPGATSGSGVANLGKMTREVWYDIPGGELSNFTNSIRALQNADSISTIQGSVAPQNTADDFAARIRAYVTAPITGDYTFWISSDDDSQLYLSTDSSKLNREKIASVSGWVNPFVWDEKPSQKSVTVPLVAGQRYFIEALHKDAIYGDHLEIAWQVPGGFRDLLPVYLLEAFVSDPADVDDDDLADAWEILHGFNVGDRGVEYPSQAANADPDGDGFTNAFEYQLGQNPNVPGGMPGYWERSVWSSLPNTIYPNLPGTYITDLKNAPHFYETPDQKHITGGLEVAPEIGGNNSGYRFRALVTPTVSGKYQLRFAADDSAEVWISSNESKFNRRLVLYTQHFTDPGQYDLYSTQSGSVDFEAGHTYFVEVLLKQGGGGCHLSMQCKLPGASGFTDFSQLPRFSYYPRAEDPDDDDLSTTWETAHGFDPQVKQTGDQSPLADPDHDLVNNRDECLGAGNPTIADTTRGGWITERFHPMFFESLRDTVKATPFFEKAGYTELLPSTEGKRFWDVSGQASRTRGFVIAPVTGKYRFWVSGGTSIELWLSTDATPFRKRRIARVGAEVGIPQGVSFANNPDFDLYTSQQSVELDLVAGQSYFVEVLQQTGHQENSHVAVAWAYNNGPRASIPFEAMGTYAPGANDADDDALPDSWEIAMGLDPVDNGLTDRPRQGDRGDYDFDGLTNREEYLAGTNPTLKDSDSDGISDVDEVKNFKGDPASFIGSWEKVVQNLDIHAPAASSMKWSSFEDGVVGERFRGSIEFDLDIPSDGLNWLVSIRGKILGQNSQVDSMPLKVSIDSTNLGRHDFTCSLGEEGALRVLTPKLTTGTHRVKVFVDNLFASKSFLLLDLELLRPTGDDLDADGVPDWLGSLMLENAWATAEEVTTPVSPFCLEGGAIYKGGVSVQVDGQALGVDTGTSDKTWFANVPLRQTGNTVMIGRYDGSDEYTSHVAWTAMEVGAVSLIEVRVGDTLKFKAPNGNNGGGGGQPVTYQVVPGSWVAEGPPGTAQYHTFENAGMFTLRSTKGNGTVSETLVKVHQASAADAIALVTQRARIIDLTGVPTDLKLDVAEPLRLVTQEVPTGQLGSRIRLESAEEGEYGLLARMPGGGPILTKVPVRVAAYAGATTANYQLVTNSIIDGYLRISVPLILDGLQPGYTVRIGIVRSGVFFEDGTTMMILTPEDFIDGQFMVRFLFPENEAGGYCHYVEVLDPQGQVIASY